MITFKERIKFWKYINYGGEFFTEHNCNSKFKDEKDFQNYLIVELKKQGFNVYNEVVNENGRADLIVFKDNLTILIELKDLRDGNAINKLNCGMEQLKRYKDKIKVDFVALGFLVPHEFERDHFLLFHCHYLNRLGFLILKNNTYHKKIDFKRFQYEVYKK